VNPAFNKVKNHLIFALDVPDRKEAEQRVKMLHEYVGCFKVGLELFVREGPDVLKVIRDHSSADIFLDLKLHDIPATMNRALESVVAHGVKYVTVHLESGEAFAKLPESVKSSRLQILAVTLLTSVSKKDFADSSYFKAFMELYAGLKQNYPLARMTAEKSHLIARKIVLERAATASKSGCAGVICSGDEVSAVKEISHRGFKLVVPGIRPAWSIIGNDDQSRVTTPAQAIERGADMIVVGRPIRDAKDPQEAAQRILEEISSVL
jgi:orotidine-5'-phosphate decarboxylase